MHSHSPATSLAPLPCTTRAPRAPCVPDAPVFSLEQPLPRRPPLGAAVHPRRQPFFPNQAHKSSSGEPKIPLRPFPVQEHRWPRRIPMRTATGGPRGPNCVFLLLLGVFCVNRGYLREESKLSGAWSQK
jgi:hypothetical protein